MDKKPYTPIEDMEVFRLFEEVSDWCWSKVNGWRQFEKDTIGSQLVRAADSVNANLVEGDGRGTDTDALRFCRYARASAREARLWIRRAIRRGLVDAAEGEAQISHVESGARLLNLLINYRLRAARPTAVREGTVRYGLVLGEPERGEN